MPLLLESGVSRVLLIGLGLPSISALFFSKFIVEKSIATLLFFILSWYVFILGCDSLSMFDYIDTPNFKNLNLMLFILYLGYGVAYVIPEEQFANSLVWACLIGGSLLAISVYSLAFSGGFDITARTYAYSAKNSVSQILLSCFVIVLFQFKNKSIYFNIGKIAFLLFIIYLILIMKSRASILGFAIIWWFGIFKIKDSKVRKYSILCTLLISFTLLIRSDLLTILIDNIILGSRDSSDLNDVSSGRGDMLFAFPNLFAEYPFFGRGRYFIESFPLASLVQYGLIGSIIHFSFIGWFVWFSKKNLSVKNKLDICAILLLLIYFFNGLFEEQAPLGPGAKCFLYWLIVGALVRYRLLPNKKLNSTIS